MNMPFPGMDPYLEHPLLWPSVHVPLMVALANQLQPQIEPRYIASVEERVYIDQPQQLRIPDVLVKKTGDTRGSLAVADAATDTPLLLEVPAAEVREPRVEILDLYQGQALIALIEVVSPSNKRRGPGRRSYRAKQRETLKRACHLVEIDLLRLGRHVLSIPRWRLEGIEPYASLACVSRYPLRHRFEVYPRGLRERLPRIKLPLVAPDADVLLDVQTALEQVYLDGRFMRRVRYQDPCIPTLSPEDQAWANERWAAYKAAQPGLFPPGNS